MHNDIIVSNCYAFLLAGYETTSTALAYAAWLLAKHPEVQERLHDEILDNFGEDKVSEFNLALWVLIMHLFFVAI